VVERDDEVIEKMFSKLGEWWDQYVKTDMPPPPRSMDDALRLHPSSKGGITKVASQETEQLVCELARLTADAKNIDVGIKEIKAEIMKEIGDAEVLTDVTGVPLVTWKSANPTTSIDYKAIVQEIDVPDEIVEKHIKERAGSRRFLLKKTGE
jgi:predicted phage-related endonuclease